MLIIEVMHAHCKNLEKQRGKKKITCNLANQISTNI